MTENVPEWQLSSRVIGELILPIMQVLPKQISRLSAAMLSTAEGKNICSMGFPTTAAGKMAAVNSSLFSMAESALVSLRSAEQRRLPLDKISLTSGDLQAVAVKVSPKGVRPMILMVAAKETDMGALFYISRTTAATLEQVLSEHAAERRAQAQGLSKQVATKA